jgi:flagellar biosynthesis chaperone FliJ
MNDAKLEKEIKELKQSRNDYKRKWEKAKKWKEEAKRMDVRYDCLIQVLDEEVGKNKRHELYDKARKKYAAIQSGPEAELQSTGPKTQG